MARDAAVLDTGRRLQVLATFDTIEVERGHAVRSSASAPVVRALTDERTACAAVCGSAPAKGGATPLLAWRAT